MAGSIAAKAKWVLGTMGIKDTPALYLDEIAASQNIRVGRADLPDDPDLSGILLFRGSKRAILINTFSNNLGRIHFTFAHELGHHFLQHTPDYIQDGQTGFRCTKEDINHEYKPQEREANQFAAELLMPENQIRPMMFGSILDYTLISNIARQFMVSKHACCNRLLEFTRDPYVVVRSEGLAVKEIRFSPAARGNKMKLKKVPYGTAAYEAIVKKKNQNGFVECDPAKWFVRTNPAIKLYEWTRGDFEHGVAMTILRW